MTKLPTILTPRKSPVQRRSQVTVDAIHIATIQVLTKEGLVRCTTTRIAERAGVSVGTLYQYYADRHALLAAALSRHISRIVAAVEASCRHLHGAPLDVMASGLVEAFLAAKFEDAAEAKALYAVSEDYGGPVIVNDASERMTAAIAVMLASAPGIEIAELDVVSQMVGIAVSAPARAVLTAPSPVPMQDRLVEHCTQLVLSYLNAVSRPVSGLGD